jgi:hypothetical protein
MEYNTLDTELTPNSSLVTRLQSKFKNVPNVTLEDCGDWITDAVSLHGNETDTTLVLLLAQAEGARNIALNVSHYFSYSDGDESIDKTMLADQYIRISNEFLNAYNSNKASGTGSSSGATFTIIKRADR